MRMGKPYITTEFITGIPKTRVFRFLDHITVTAEDENVLGKV